MLQTLYFTIRIGSTPTADTNSILDFYLYTAYAEHYIYLPRHMPTCVKGLLGSAISTVDV